VFVSIRAIMQRDKRPGEKSRALPSTGAGISIQLVQEHKPDRSHGDFVGHRTKHEYEEVDCRNRAFSG
jgi:hypothetical protein